MLGASTGDVVRLLSRDYVLLMIASVVVAIPISVVAARSWLDSFAYRIEPGVGMIGAAALVAVIIGSLTVGVQAARAALADPVRSLRSE